MKINEMIVKMFWKDFNCKCSETEVEETRQELMRLEKEVDKHLNRRKAKLLKAVS